MWVFLWIGDTDVRQLDVEILKHKGERVMSKPWNHPRPSKKPRCLWVWSLTWSTECSVPQMLRRDHVEGQDNIYTHHTAHMQSGAPTSGRSWAPPPRLYPPETWRRSRKAVEQSSTVVRVGVVVVVVWGGVCSTTETSVDICGYFEPRDDDENALKMSIL